MNRRPNSEAQQMFSLLEQDLPPKDHEGIDPDETLETMQGILEMFFNDRVRHQIRSRDDHGRACKAFAYALKKSLLNISGEDLPPPKKPRKKMDLTPEERAERSRRMKAMWRRKKKEAAAAAAAAEAAKKKAVK